MADTPFVPFLGKCSHLSIKTKIGLFSMSVEHAVIYCFQLSMNKLDTIKPVFYILIGLLL